MAENYNVNIAYVNDETEKKPNATAIKQKQIKAKIKVYG